MLRKTLVALAVALVLVVAVVAMQPSEFRVVRSATIGAPPAAVFAQVNDFHAWEAWSPWARIDPAMQETYEGAPAGPGAVYAWAGNHEVGEGRMTITESRPNERIRIALEFLKPFAASNTAEFTFAPEGDHTVVTWSMSGRNDFVAKAIGLVIDMDQMIGGMFEQGLAQMNVVLTTTG